MPVTHEDRQPDTGVGLDLAEHVGRVPVTEVPGPATYEGSRAGTQLRVIAPFVGVVDGRLRVDVALRASVIHERLVAEHGCTGHYQRVKMYVAEARPRIAAELGCIEQDPMGGLHRRFAVVPGAQAQVDWGR